MGQKRLELRITGIVQGVFFRSRAQDEAERLCLTGWVANRGDGSVELVAEGPEAALTELQQWCRRGPPGARVDHLDARWLPASGELRRFVVKH